MGWLALLGIFAKPLGAAINNGISAASGAAIVWATQKGADAGIVVPVVSAIALAISTAISGLAATQGVQIPVINNDNSNGVVVVPATPTAQAAKVDAPLP